MLRFGIWYFDIGWLIMCCIGFTVGGIFSDFSNKKHILAHVIFVLFALITGGLAYYGKHF